MSKFRIVISLAFYALVFLAGLFSPTKTAPKPLALPTAPVETKSFVPPMLPANEDQVVTLPDPDKNPKEFAKVCYKHNWNVEFMAEGYRMMTAMEREK